MAKTRRKRGQDQADIGAASDVIRNDDGWAFEILQVVAADYAGVAEELGGGPDQRVINDQAREADRFALRPTRVMVGVGVFLWRLVRWVARLVLANPLWILPRKRRPR